VRQPRRSPALLGTAKRGPHYCHTEGVFLSRRREDLVVCNQMRYYDEISRALGMTPCCANPNFTLSKFERVHERDN